MFLKNIFNFKSVEKEAIPQDPRKNEVAWGESAFLSFGGGFESFNPDVLVAKKGSTIYKKMLVDSQVKAVYNLIVNVIISREYNFVKQNEEPIQDDIIDFFNHNLDIVLKGTWIKALKTVLLGKAQGFSISEKIWSADSYKNKDWWFIKQIKTRPYETFQFRLDNYDNVTALLQDQRGSEKILDPSKFIIYVNNPDIDPVWGESDLKAAYRPYWVKDIVNKFWSIWLERIAGGVLVATPDKEAPNLSEHQRNKLENMLKNVQKATGLMVPQGWNLEVVQAQDTEAFEKSIVVQNREIAKALLVPDLLGFSERGSNGSRSLGETQFDAFMMIVKEQGDYLADVMNEQFFSQLAAFNFGIKDFPLFKFENLTITQRREIATSWKDAVAGGIVVNTFEDEERTRELLLYEQREETEEDKIVTPSEKPEEKKPEDKEDKEDKEAETQKEEAKIDKKTINNSSPILEFKEEEQDFSARIDFASLKTDFEDNEDGFVKDMSKPYDKMFSEIDTYYKKSINTLPTAKGKIDYEKLSEGVTKSISTESKILLNQSIRKNLKINYDLGREQAKETLNSTIKEQPQPTKDKIKLSIAMSGRMACKDDPWTVANFIDGVNLEAIESWVKSKSFTITGDLTADLISDAQQILVNGVTDEKGYAEIVQDLKEILPTALGTPNAEGEVTAKSNRARLETIARTNITNVFNQAQLSVYADPELGDFVDGLEYAATIDSRTTDFCEAYNNRKFKRNDPIWGTITPPNHFNCRSVMIPITIFDKWKPSKALKSVQPSKGFN